MSIFYSPFKFLDSYTLADRNIFFGRDQEIAELYRRVFESKILLVYGVSGTGKSSLINCGLASRFDESDWLPVNVRRGNNMIESLDVAINKQALTPLKGNQQVSEKLKSIYLDHFKPVFLIFDQFEELFIFGSNEEKTDFIRLIKEIFVSKVQCRIVLVIREEFLAGITEFEYDLPDIFTNRFRVEKMKRANAITAVEGPCRVNNIETETGFSEEIIDKLCPTGDEIELTYLQIYLDRIFHISETEKNSNGNLRFSKELISKAGSVSDLLGQFLEEQIREFDDPNTGMAILKSFVSVQGTKRQMNESEILDAVKAFGTEIGEPNLIKYLTKFVDLRILRERDEAGRFELRHDALAGKIYEKFTLLEKELLEVRLFVENAWLAFDARKAYLNRDDLEYLSPYEKRLFLPPVLSKFVQESKDKLRSQQRALRRLTSIVAGVFLLIVAAGVQYYLNRKGYAETKELTTLAILQGKVDPLTSMNTAFQIRQKDSVSTVVQGIILDDFNTLLQKKIAAGDSNIPKELLPRAIPVKGSILSMRINKTGNQLFGWTNEKEVFACGINDSLVRSFKVENEIVTVEMSDNARYFAVIYSNSTGNVYTQDGKKMFGFETTVNRLMNKRLVRFFPSGKHFMAAVKNNNAVIYDSTGASLFKLEGHTGRVNSLDISPDGRFVVTASCDKKALIWNFNYKTLKFSPYDTLVRYRDKNYEHPDSLIGPNDTIWSCEFDKTGRYILTASADSMLNIWSLNGILRNEAYAFAMNSKYGIQWYWPLWNSSFTTEFTETNKSNIENSCLSIYFNKVCDATFAADNKAIIASKYSYDYRIVETQDGIYRTCVLYFDARSIAYGNAKSTNQYILTAQHQSVPEGIQTIKLLEITFDRRLFAVVPNQKEVIQVVAFDGYQVLNIPGSFPLFSKEGESLFYINGKAIRFLPVDLLEIRNLVIDKKLFGNPESGENIWKIL
jgi:WD40 repeat protein